MAVLAGWLVLAVVVALLFGRVVAVSERVDSEHPHRSATGELGLPVAPDPDVLPVSRAIQPNAMLREVGLITLDDKGKVVAWRAWFHADGARAALYLADPKDYDALERVRERFTDEAANEATGICSCLDTASVGGFGWDPEAVLVIEAEPGFWFSPALHRPDVSVTTPGSTLGRVADEKGPAAPERSGERRGSARGGPGAQRKTQRASDREPGVDVQQRANESARDRCIVKHLA